MITYLLLNAGFAVVAHLLLFRQFENYRSRSLWGNLALLLMATLIFNNLIIGLGIVSYDPALILGWRLGFIPVEDFAYAVVAAFGLPAVYIWLGKRGIDGK